MKRDNMITTVLIEAHETFTFTEVCSQCELSEHDLLDWMEQGLLGDFPIAYRSVQFNPIMIARLHSAKRLQHDLDINLSGVVLALELLDKISRLQDELTILRRQAEVVR